MSRSYRHEVEKHGFNPIIYNEYTQNMNSKLKGVDFIVLFTGAISHQAAFLIRSMAKNNDIPLFCCHSPGISSLRHCLECLSEEARRKLDGGKERLS